MTNHIEIANALIAKKAKQAKSFDADTRKNPLAFKAAIAVMFEAEQAKANADKDKNKVFYAKMRNGGLPAFFDANGKQNRAVAMELSGLRKCAENRLHELPDVDFKAAITNHEKEITSWRQFATDHFKTVSDRAGGDDAGANGDDAGGDDIAPELPAEKSIADLYRDFLNAAFAGDSEAFYKWLQSDNAAQIEAALKNAKRKAAPELPALKSLAG